MGCATSAPGMDWETLPPQGTQFPDTSQVQGEDVRAAPGTPNGEAVSQEWGLGVSSGQVLVLSLRWA